MSLVAAVMDNTTKALQTQTKGNAVSCSRGFLVLQGSDILSDNQQKNITEPGGWCLVLKKTDVAVVPKKMLAQSPELLQASVLFSLTI